MQSTSKHLTRITTQTTIDRYAPHLDAVLHFCSTFSHGEARCLLHKMMRSALAMQNMLNKEDVLDLIFLRDELIKLIRATEKLAKSPHYNNQLGKFFRYAPATGWIEILDLLFYAAIYDGLFTSPGGHNDIYHDCRGLHALVNTCMAIYDAGKIKPG